MNGNANGNGVIADEEQPLLGRKPTPPSLLSKCRKQMTAEVSRSWADLVLLLCYVVTGLLDSASTQVWGAFVSMQTGTCIPSYNPHPRADMASFIHAQSSQRRRLTPIGNTVFVGLGIATVFNPPVSARLYKSGVSLLSFCVGSFFFARFHRYFSPKRRWVLCASFAAQALLIVAAAVVVTVWPAPGDERAVGWTVLVPLALVAFQSCGQAVTSRALRYNALTSVVLTSIYCDLFSDQDLFKVRNVERNRRAAAPALLLVGAVAGGLFSHSSFGIQGALWAAAGIKSIMVVLWFFWPTEDEES